MNISYRLEQLRLADRNRGIAHGILGLLHLGW